MAKTKKSRNQSKHQIDPADSANSNVTTNEGGQSSEPVSENRDGGTDQDISRSTGSQEYVRPKGMDA